MATHDARFAHTVSTDVRTGGERPFRLDGDAMAAQWLTNHTSSSRGSPAGLQAASGTSESPSKLSSSSGDRKSKPHAQARATRA
ncbi:hypothetical protein HDG33_007568 [Paraburkholderia sp. Cpub6]|nr:hypothetical protein [Paraburkholderia sp. Cpub6]